MLIDLRNFNSILKSKEYMCGNVDDECIVNANSAREAMEIARAQIGNVRYAHIVKQEKPCEK